MPKPPSPIEQFRQDLGLADFDEVVTLTGLPRETLERRNEAGRLQAHEQKLVDCLRVMNEIDRYTKRYHSGHITLGHRRSLAFLLGRELPSVGRKPKLYRYQGRLITARQLASEVGATYKAVRQHLCGVPSGNEIFSSDFPSTWQVTGRGDVR